MPGGPRSRERLTELDDGRVAYDLRRPWSDGTHRIVWEPLDVLARRAALVPPPRACLVTYHGVLAPAAADDGGAPCAPAARRGGPRSP